VKNTTLSINDNAPGSPQTIALQGSATDFCVDPPGLTTQTITAGASAAYQVDLVAFTGFTGTVALACTDPAAASACTVLPASASVTGAAPVPVQVSVTTTAAGSVASAKPSPSAHIASMTPASMRLLLAALMLIALWSAASTRGVKRAAQLAQSMAIGMLLAISLAACFGGGGGAATSTGTPSGIYTLTVTATYTPSGSSTTVTRSIPLTLTVQ
jgi:hypothetical protein